VRDEARKQRVAASFLPLYGPLPEDQQTVSLQSLEINPLEPPENPDFLEVGDFQTRRLTVLSVRVALRSSQVAQADLSTALVAFRRAATLIARAEDQLVFNGQAAANAPVVGLPQVFATGGDTFLGLFLTAIGRGQVDRILAPFDGPQLVAAVTRATGALEQAGHLGPFALVLNTELFTTAYDPLPNSLVLPADRIKPLLGGPLLRSSLMNLGGPEVGVVVSLSAELLDLVIASEIGVRLIQVTTSASPRHVFRVSERLTLRIKQPTAIRVLMR